MNPNTKKMRFLAFFLLSLLLQLNMRAQSINEAEARERAQAFLSARFGRTPKALRTAHKGRRAKGQKAASACDYYIFNTEADDGFVIVSGDERAVPILGYSDSGSFQEGKMPEGLKVLLEDYSEQMAGLDDYDAQAQNGRRRAPARKAIAPLIETKWGQSAPYNNSCPQIDNNPTYTGCVATAMAQVIYYHYNYNKRQGNETKYKSTQIPGYTTRTAKLELPELEGITFDWDAMTPTYSSTATGTAADAVAKLMRYCGQALQMDYKTNASSAFNEAIPDALKTHFSFNQGIRNAYRKCYTYAEWVELIYSDLAADRPVVMGGQSASGGHAFVCDGYESDDYFHINWGWNGGNDGYFRLAVLQPYEQGSNGKSTLDGFTFAQEAVVGIQSSTDETNGYCLSLEDFYLNDYPTSSSHTFTRASADDAFTVGLNYTLYSYKQGTNKYDIGFKLLVDPNDLEDPTHLIQNQSMTYNTNYVGPYTLTISSVPDGTYYIKVMSRPRSPYEQAGPWMECFDGKQYMMTAVVSGNNLTINVPLPKPTKPASATITVDGNKTVGYEQDINASITGGNGDYHGSLFLYVDDALIMGKDVEIPAEKTADVRFSYIPTTDGDNVIKITTAKSTDADYVIGTETVTILASDASNTQELTIEPTITNLTADGKLYGNAVRTTVRVKNPSTTNSYAGQVYCSLRMYDKATDGVDNYVGGYMNIKNESVVIPKSESAENLSYVDIHFDYDELDPSKFYRLRFSYLNSNAENNTASGPIVSGENDNAIEMSEGYRLYAADGSMSLCPLSGTIDAGSSLCADLRGISNFSGVTITKSTNPNCIYLLATGVATPDALSSCNVVRGTSVNHLTTEMLTLQDGYDFFTPVPFTANAVNYTRTFTLAANETSGWNTILLPFNVSSISCEVIGPVDWFHYYSDTGKNFWVRAFTGDDPGNVDFFYAQEMAANTPYIIAVPDNRWGSAWQMTGRAVTFSGTNARIEPTTECSLGASNYKFSGCTYAKSLQDVYLLNNDGRSFVFTDTQTDVPAFRAWFAPVAELSSLTSPALSIGRPTTTGIGLTPDPSLSREEREGAWSDLSGRKLHGAPTKPGLYINNGKTIVIR